MIAGTTGRLPMPIKKTAVQLLRPPPEVDKEPNRMCQDILIYPGAVDRTPEPRGQLPGTWTPPVKLNPDQFVFGLPIPAHLSSDKQLPVLETTPAFDRFGEALTEPTTGHGSLRSQAGKQCVTSRITGQLTTPYWGTGPWRSPRQNWFGD